MTKYGKNNVKRVLGEYRHPDANGENGSVIAFETDAKVLNYTVLVDYVRDEKGRGTWTQSCSVSSEKAALEGFNEEVESINARVSAEIELQKKEKEVVENFRSLYWLELEKDPNQIIICKNYDSEAACGKQWRWGRRFSWQLSDQEKAKTVFCWEISKLTKTPLRKNSRVLSAKKTIVKNYHYLQLVEFLDKKGGYAVFEDGIEGGFLAHFSAHEKKYALWLFDSRKVEVDSVLARQEVARQYYEKLERLKSLDLKVIGFTSYDNDAIKDMVCGAEQSVAFSKLVEFMRENGLRFSGSYHQNGEDGVPVFNNARKYVMSTRAWGGLMANATNTLEPHKGRKDMSYCKWAWSDYLEPIYPSQKGIRVYPFGFGVEKEEATALCDLEVDTRPDYATLARELAKEGLTMPRVISVSDFLSELDHNGKKGE